MSILTLNIRNATLEEAEQLVQLHYSAVHQGAADDYPRSVLDSWSPPPDESRYAWMREQIDSGSNAVLVAEEQSGVISGFCMFSNAEALVRALYVLPERTANGIGRLLLKRAESIIAERGSSHIKLNASRNAVGFYESAGYGVVQPMQQRLLDGTSMDCVEMSKSLGVPQSDDRGRAELVRAWVEAFNRRDINALADFYAEDAVNHQVAEAPVSGRAAIREMFARGFAMADMVCIIENVFEDGEWAILEWRDPKGLRGCGFFHVVDGMIIFQRGYWDKLSFLRQQGLPIPRE
jgi:GNAT superfamily N-acetyltransferase